MVSMEAIISQHPFFQGLAPEQLSLIAGCAKNVRVNAGETLFREGEPADQFYLIRYGRVALEIFIPGRGPVTLQTVQEDDVLGWSWLFEPYRWHYHARAQQLTRAVAFDGACLRGKCNDDHHLGYELMKRFARIITERLQAARMHMLDIYAANGVGQNVASVTMKANDESRL